MDDEQQQPQYPYPPATPYAPQAPVPPQPQAPMPPQPQGGYPYAPRPMPMKMPAGMKMPPRPMGYPMPAGMKMPPRPMGYPMPGYMPAAPVAPGGQPQPEMPYQPQPMQEPAYPAPVEHSFPSEPEQEIDSAPETAVEPEQETEAEPQPDEYGIIDDLPEEEVEEAGPYDKNFASDLGLPPAFVRTPVILSMLFVFLACGLGLGFFYGSLQNRGNDQLPGVVMNDEIPKGRPRCGVAQPGQGCVLYIMNASRSGKEAREFFELSAKMADVQTFQVDTNNVKYATKMIPPGYIALINIPPIL